MKKIIRLTESELTNLIKRIIKESDDFQFDIEEIDCNPLQKYSGGYVDIDEDDTIVIRYCRGDKKSLRKLTEKGRILMYDKYGYDFSDDKQDTLSTMRGYFGNK